MLNEELIFSRLKQKGFKLTKARTKIINIFESNHSISVTEILNKFKKENLLIDKSTIYREIDFLLKQNIIKQLDFRERGKKYELVNDKHHHHLICISCKKVINYELEEDWNNQEKKIKDQQGFKVLSHSLEFFGLCSKCQILNNSNN